MNLIKHMHSIKHISYISQYVSQYVSQCIHPTRGMTFVNIMKHKTLLPLLLTTLISGSAVADNGGIHSLRSDSIADQAPAAALKKKVETNTPIERDFFQQPPLIPHDIRGYEVNKDVNTCLRCHSWKNAAKYGATKISITHYYDRNGKQRADVAPGRYFCLQCHVPQADAKPLKGNNFEPVDSLK